MDAMLDKYGKKLIGSVVSIADIDGSHLQGLVTNFDLPTRIITLKRPYRDGVPMGMSLNHQVSSCSAIRVLRAPESPQAARRSSLSDSMRNSIQELSFHDELPLFGGSLMAAALAIPIRPIFVEILDSKNLPSNSTVSDESVHVAAGDTVFKSSTNAVDSSSPSAEAPLEMKSYRDVLLGEMSGFVKQDDADALRPGSAAGTHSRSGEKMFNRFPDADAATAVFSSKREQVYGRGDANSRKKWNDRMTCTGDKREVGSMAVEGRVSFTASCVVCGPLGCSVPFLTYHEKQRFLRAAEVTLSSDTFHVLVADRLVAFLLIIIKKYGLFVTDLVIVCSVYLNPRLLYTLSRHVTNRGFRWIEYGSISSFTCPNMLATKICCADDLPIDGYNIVISLEDNRMRSDLAAWYERLPETAHVISVEKFRPTRATQHILMIGVGTELELAESNIPSVEVNRGLSAVADIGIPFLWMDDRSAACLREIFATETLTIV